MNHNGRAEKRDFWSAHLKDWKESGLSQCRYCREHGLNIHTFRYWRARVGTGGVGATVPELKGRLRLVRFGDLPEPAVALKVEPIRIQFSDCQVFVDAGVDAAHLALVIGVLRSS